MTTTNINKIRFILIYTIFLIPPFNYAHEKCAKSFSKRKKLFRSYEQSDDMPSRPERIYEGKGWIDWGHFLGTGRAANRNKKFRDYKTAKKYVQEKGISTRKHYDTLSKNGELPDDMPSHPERIYEGKGWIDWGHFLGTGRAANRNKKFRDYKTAKKYVQEKGISTRKHYDTLSKNGELPDDMPSNPNNTYKGKGWIDWGHFLGTGRAANRNKKFRDYKTAKKYVQEKGISTQRYYYTLSKNGELPDDMPSSPDRTYKGKGWINWKYFLGTLKMLTFRKAQDYAINKAGIQTVEELIRWLRSDERPLNFPKKPQNFYEEWTTARNFLKIHEPGKMNYSQSKKYMQSLQFSTKIDAIKWLASEDRPEELPVNPQAFYGKQWEGWKFYLGLHQNSQGMSNNVHQEQTNEEETQNSEEFRYDEEIPMQELLEAFGL